MAAAAATFECKTREDGFLVCMAVIGPAELAVQCNAVRVL
jgi:hypothetical protein